jgi:hypothetical protein
MDRRHFRLRLYAEATPVVVWRSLAGRFIGRSDPDTPCVERPARQLRGTGAFDHCCDPAGPLAFRPGRPKPSSSDRAETDLVAVEITIRRAPGSRAWGKQWSRSSSTRELRNLAALAQQRAQVAHRPQVPQLVRVDDRAHALDLALRDVEDRHADQPAHEPDAKPGG